MSSPNRSAPHPTSIYFDDETRDLVARLQEESGLNRSAVIRIAVKEMAANDPKRRQQVIEALKTLNAALAP
jgi:hypothetical protein